MKLKLHHVLSGFVNTKSNNKQGLVRTTEWHHEVSMQKTPYKILSAISSSASHVYSVLALQETKIAKAVINRYEWVYSPMLPVSLSILFFYLKKSKLVLNFYLYIIKCL